MADLRWVLLALGVLVIVAVYLWSQGVPQRWLAPLAAMRQSRAAARVRVEPEFDGPVAPADTESELEVTDAPEPKTDSIVTLRVIPAGKSIACDKVVLALRAAGLKHGRYGIFHKQASELVADPLFSVANLTEPGSFDLSKLSETKIPGMSFFMVLPGTGDPVERFDAMVATAREIAREIGAELRDENGSSWSIQRERYVREEIIEYSHLLDKPSLH